MQRGAEKAGVVRRDRDRDTRGEKEADPPGRLGEGGKNARGDVGGRADVENDAPAGQNLHEGGILRGADPVRDPDGLQPAERGGHRFGAAPLARVDERRETEDADARVNSCEVARRKSGLVAAEAEAAGAGPGTPLVVVEDPVSGLGPPLPDGVVKDGDPIAAAALVGRENLFDGIPDGIPRKADPFDDRRRHVDLDTTDPLAAEAADEIPGDRGVVRGTGEAAADVAIEVEEGPEVTAEETARANGRKVGENGAGPARGEPDERGRRDAAFEVKMELDLRSGPEAGEKAPLSARGRHGAPSYGGLPPGVLPRDRLWIRAAAYGVDLLLLAGGPLLLSTLVIVAILLYSADPPATLGLGFFAAQGLFALLFLLRDTGGASPGKRLFGLRLVREGGRPVGVLASIARNVPMLVPGWNLIELLSVIRRDDGRRGGDRLAGTTLVES